MSLYSSPSQSADEFEKYLSKLNLTMESITQKNSFLAVLIAMLMRVYQNGGRMIRQLKKVLK